MKDVEGPFSSLCVVGDCWRLSCVAGPHKVLSQQDQVDLVRAWGRCKEVQITMCFVAAGSMIIYPLYSIIWIILIMRIITTYYNIHCHIILYYPYIIKYHPYSIHIGWSWMIHRAAQAPRSQRSQRSHGATWGGQMVYSEMTIKIDENWGYPHYGNFPLFSIIEQFLVLFNII